MPKRDRKPNAVDALGWIACALGLWIGGFVGWVVL
jgi:hypothetical protein